ncbi:hypothetical protein C8R42DRAFT_116135 [Lentinula raphanica]|nr:hypothetical protein C8R42DRAFT_116135 [Lentinula raphanica]
MMRYFLLFVPKFSDKNPPLVRHFLHPTTTIFPCWSRKFFSTFVHPQKTRIHRLFCDLCLEMHLNRSVLYALLFSSAIVYTTCSGSPLPNPTHISSDTRSPLPGGPEASASVASLCLELYSGDPSLRQFSESSTLMFNYMKAAANDFASTKLPEVDLVAHPNSIDYEIKQLDGPDFLPNRVSTYTDTDTVVLWYMVKITPGEKHQENSHKICGDGCAGTLGIVRNPKDPLDHSESIMMIDEFHSQSDETVALHRIGPDYNRRFFNPSRNDRNAVGVKVVNYSSSSRGRMGRGRG